MYFYLKSVYRHVRIGKLPTLWLGPQYQRSRERIEIDITYACNLHCLNCNRSVKQAPTAMEMSLDQIGSFVRQSITKQKKWKTIRVLGGEPTLHSQFFSVIDCLDRYRSYNPDCLIEVVSNGYGKTVQRRLDSLPGWVAVENSYKKSNVQTAFAPFNMAPLDEVRYRHSDYRNGCIIAAECGMGLGPGGYYPCAIAAGIDRITGWGIGRKDLPEDNDSMTDLMARFCGLCGRFHDGHFVPFNLRPSLNEEQISPTWKRLYDEWEKRKREDHFW
ncbi:radical SAM protein [Desulfatiferula olefinivorans]